MMRKYKGIGKLGFFFLSTGSTKSKVPLKTGHITGSEAFVSLGVLRWSCMMDPLVSGTDAAWLLWVPVLCTTAYIFTKPGGIQLLEAMGVILAHL